jgi:hypothetical protein
MVNKAIAVIVSDQGRGQIFRLALVHRNLVATIQEYFHVVNDPVAFPCRLSGSFVFV